MLRELRITGDGSHTLFVRDLDEPYHSIYGSIQESEHVFIDSGFKILSGKSVRVLEMGLGTGLNLLLTLKESIRTGKKVLYHGIDIYPLSKEEYKGLNYMKLIEGIPDNCLDELHEGPWGTEFKLHENFTVLKELKDFRKIELPGHCDLVYFDAFDPVKQPELWTADVFKSISDRLIPGGVLVTYSSKGDVRRALTACGFMVEKIPGPRGKREMTRAFRR